MENNEITIKKVPLKSLISLLVGLYNKGIDFVDIIGNPDEEQDKLAISFTDDYMSDEAKKEFKENLPPEVTLSTTGKLSDNDINQLL